MLKDKYRPLFDTADQLHIKDLDAQETGGTLNIKGTAPYQLEKNLFWDKLKEIPGWQNEVSADIRVEKNDLFGVYEVQPGDSLSKVAKKYYGDPNRFQEIFDANKDVLKDPNKINPGQKLKLPNP